MSSVNLNSEAFERAAYHLAGTLESFSLSADIERLSAATRQFSESVDKLQKILGMQAENDQRKALGHSMAYTEDDFWNV